MSSQLRVDKIVPVDGAPTGGGGGIIQVVKASKTDTDSFSVATTAQHQYTTLTATITPKFNTSKILIMMHLSLCPTTSDVKMHYGVQRTIGGSGATNVGVGDAASNRQRMSGGMLVETNPAFTVNYSFLDSPSTTSACAYYPIVGHDSSGTKTFYINRSNGDSDSAQNARYMSSIILYEVSG